ncbi:MAG: site-specific DNA-methyltransferase [Acidobacteria bacterium]|nr:site-specific DNA-methyltransferase [Acidobacteriota bacterium]
MSSETIKDLMPQTPDLNQERVAKLKELFPDLFTGEGKLDPRELERLIEPASDGETERYEFRWFGKSRAKREAFTPSRATLVFDEARSCNPQSAENLIIEGENLEVLKLLLCAYREQIKCIYIDQPYNTGRDFVYRDNYAEGRKPYWEQTGVTENGVRVDTNADTDGRFHSNWMNMMYSRLLVARQLLKPDGVIFISMGDEEVHNLRRICDEVFGGENFEGHIHWRRRYNQPNDRTKMIALVAEHILSYSKNREEYKKSGVGKIDLTGELNEEDGGSRKYILVQLPELTGEQSEADKAGYKKISDITIERNKRVVERLIAEKKGARPPLFEKPYEADALKNRGFKVYRLEKSHFARTDWSPDATKTEAENVRALKQYIADKEAQLDLSFDRDKLLTEILLKQEGFTLNYTVAPYSCATSNQILRVTGDDKEALVCLDSTLAPETVAHFKTHTELKFICLERALNTTLKWNLHHFLGEKFKAL